MIQYYSMGFGAKKDLLSLDHLGPLDDDEIPQLLNIHKNWQGMRMMNDQMRDLTNSDFDDWTWWEYDGNIHKQNSWSVPLKGQMQFEFWMLWKNGMDIVGRLMSIATLRGLISLHTPKSIRDVLLEFLWNLRGINHMSIYRIVIADLYTELSWSSLYESILSYFSGLSHKSYVYTGMNSSDWNNKIKKWYFLSHGGTPSHHPIFRWGFSMK